MFEIARRRRREGPDLRAPGQVPERAQPDRGHRRLALRPRPRVRPEVQPPDRGHGPAPQGRPDRGRPPQEGRHPRRPRRRLLPAQRVGRAGRVQRRRRRRDQRLPPAPARDPVRPELRRALLRLRPRPLRAHRGVRQRRLRHLPGLRPRGPLPALRHRDPPRQLAPQRARLLGHGGQRHVDAQLALPRQQRRHLRRLVRLRPPGHAAGLLEVDRQPGQLEQRELLHERPRRLLQEHAVREAQEEDRVPAVPGAGRIGLHPLRRQLEPHPGQRDLRQLALRRAAVLGPGLGPRRERPGQAVRHVQRQPVRRQPDGPRRATTSAPPTASTSSGTSRASATAGSATRRPAARSRATRRRSRSAPRARSSSSRPPRRSSPPRPRAPRGTRTRCRTRPAAPGSRPRPSLRDEVGAGGDRPAPRRSGRAAARR